MARQKTRKNKKSRKKRRVNIAILSSERMSVKFPETKELKKPLQEMFEENTSVEEVI